VADINKTGNWRTFHERLEINGISGTIDDSVVNEEGAEFQLLLRLMS
jgi:hypothetical protein